MTSHYMPIPSDSDEEDDDMSVTALLSDSDGGSDRTRSTERSHFFSQGVSEPEEDDTNDAAPLSPIPSIHFGMGARTIRTARKRVAIPIRRRVTRSPEPAIPATDPYLRPTNGSQGWERTLNTLREWRNAGRYPPIFEEGESSAARQEPLLDTTPIIVDRMVSQENRLDLMEDALMEMPGSETIEELQGQISNAEEHVAGVYDALQDLRERLEGSTWKFKDMERRMDHAEHSLEQTHTLAAIVQGYEAYILKEEHIHKKGGK